MKYTKTESTSSPMIMVELNKDEQIKVQPGAMVYHNGKVNIEGKRNGSLGGAIMKKFATGENFFITTATGTENGGLIGVAPGGLGDIFEIKVGPSQWCMNDGVFLASDPGVEITSKSQGLGKALFGGTGGFFIMKTSGEGNMIINAFGSLVELELDGTKDYVVDNGHIVCWEESLTYKMERASGMFGFKTGEGLVCRFSGKGKVVIQTRNILGFAGILAPHIVKG